MHSAMHRVELNSFSNLYTGTSPICSRKLERGSGVRCIKIHSANMTRYKSLVNALPGCIEEDFRIVETLI